MCCKLGTSYDLHRLQHTPLVQCYTCVCVGAAARLGAVMQGSVVTKYVEDVVSTAEAEAQHKIHMQCLAALMRQPSCCVILMCVRPGPYSRLVLFVHHAVTTLPAPKPEREHSTWRTQHHIRYSATDQLYIMQYIKQYLHDTLYRQLPYAGFVTLPQHRHKRT
jgi:hypothetical protein